MKDQHSLFSVPIIHRGVPSMLIGET